MESIHSILFIGLRRSNIIASPKSTVHSLRGTVFSIADHLDENGESRMVFAGALFANYVMARECGEAALPGHARLRLPGGPT